MVGVWSALNNQLSNTLDRTNTISICTPAVESFGTDAHLETKQNKELFNNNYYLRNNKNIRVVFVNVHVSHCYFSLMLLS